MIPLLLSVTLGAGMLLLYEGLTNPRPAAGDGAEGRHGELRPVRAVREFLSRAGLYDVTPLQFALFSLGTGLACSLVAHLALGWAVVSLVATGLGLATPFAYYLYRHDRRRAALQGALSDAIGQLRDAIRSGLSVQEAFVALARSGPEALRSEFGLLVRRMRLDGFAAALAATQERLADPVFDMVAATLVLNDRLGGRNVTQVLDRLTYATRAQLGVQREIRAHQARNVLSARIVAAVPLVLLVAIRQVNPSYLAVFDDGWGQLVLTGCLASIALGYAGMLWVTRLPAERRVLR